MWQTAFGKKEKKVLNTLKSKKFQGITKKKKKKNFFTKYMQYSTFVFLTYLSFFYLNTLLIFNHEGRF